MNAPATMTMEQAEAMLKPGRLLIGGEWISKGAGEFVHINPTTGTAHPPIVMAGASEVNDAVQAARAGFKVWHGLPVDARRDALLRMADLIRQHAAELATLVTLDNGSPTILAMAGSKACADNFTYYAGWVDKIGGDVIPVWPATALDYAIHEPYGVIGAIIPWNVPLYNIGQVVAPALAAGNAIVLKAPELAPFAVLRIGELIAEAGIPAGVVNIVAGGPECGAAMVAHQGIDKIHFIGSGNTAKHIMRSAADTLKPLTCELGGKSANIVFPDADLRAACAQAAFHSMGNTGQGCLIASRLLVHDSIYDQFVPMVLGVIQSIKVGNPLEQGVMIGPVITSQAADRIMGVIEQAKAAADGQLILGGERLGGELANGNFIAPTVFGDVSNSSSLAQNEVFGPVLAVIRFSDEDEAIQIANDTEFGLAAYVHTHDLRRAHRTAAALESGTVWINSSGLQIGAPFGGVKQSGWGRMGGKYGLEDFMRPKNVYIPLT